MDGNVELLLKHMEVSPPLHLVHSLPGTTQHGKVESRLVAVPMQVQARSICILGLPDIAALVEFEPGAKVANISGALIVQPAFHGYDHRYVSNVLRRFPNKFAGTLLADPTPGGGGVAALQRLVLDEGYHAVRFNPYLWPEGQRMTNQVPVTALHIVISPTGHRACCLGSTNQADCGSQGQQHGHVAHMASRDTIFPVSCCDERVTMVVLIKQQLAIDA